MKKLKKELQVKLPLHITTLKWKEKNFLAMIL